jgi:steroid delta-isomerase-like uncharacterized protein
MKEDSQMALSNAELVRQFCDAVTSGDFSRLDPVLIEDYQHHDPSLPPEAQQGREAYKQGVQVFKTAMPDGKLEAHEVIAEGDRVAARLTYSGTHQGDLMGIPPTGRSVSIDMLGTWRIANGKVAEGWINFDALGMLQQIGAAPGA